MADHSPTLPPCPRCLLHENVLVEITNTALTEYDGWYGNSQLDQTAVQNVRYLCAACGFERKDVVYAEELNEVVISDAADGEESPETAV